MMNLGWTFPLSFSTLEERVASLNDALDRRLVMTTMRKLDVPREEAERIVENKVQAALARNLQTLGV